MKILLTGFEPFNQSAINPSAEVVQHLPDAPGVQIVRAVLPVSYQKAGQEIMSLLDHHAPDALLMLGQAAGRPCVSLERLAINLCDSSTKDNDGVCLHDAPLCPDGPLAYMSSLPLRQIVDALLANDIPCKISNSAGLFVCNSLFYTAMHHILRQGLCTMAGFVHLPLLPSQAAEKSCAQPYMPLDKMQEAVSQIIITISQNLNHPHHVDC